MSIKVSIALVLVGMLAGYLLAKQLTPDPVTQKLTTFRDKIITVTKTIKEPSGRIETEITSTEDKQVDKKVVVAKPPPQWQIGLAYQFDRTYQADISRRIIGPVLLSVGASTAGQLNVGLRVEF